MATDELFWPGGRYNKLKSIFTIWTLMRPDSSCLNILCITNNESWLCKQQQQQLQFKFTSKRAFPQLVRCEIWCDQTNKQVTTGWLISQWGKSQTPLRQHNRNDKSWSHTLQSPLPASTNKSGSDEHFPPRLSFFSQLKTHTETSRNIWIKYNTCLEAFHGEMWPEEERENTVYREQTRIICLIRNNKTTDNYNYTIQTENNYNATYVQMFYSWGIGNKL